MSILPKNNIILQELENHLLAEVKPKAVEIDRDPQALKIALQGLAKRNLLTVHIPQEYGGQGFTHHEYHLFKKILGRYSGALLFLQTQHQTAAKFILNGTNEILKTTYLPDMCNGKRLIGVGFAQLRQWRKPPVIAVRCENGYRIENATVRFITGFNFFQEIILGFVAEVDNQMQEIFALIPFINSTENSHNTLQFSAPMKLTVACATNTVSLQIKNWFIPDEKVFHHTKLGGFVQRGLTTTNLDSFIAGTITAILDLIETNLPPSAHSLITSGITALKVKLSNYEEKILARQPETLIAPIRIHGIRLCDETLAFARQVFRGRIMQQDDLISQQLTRLAHERDLFSVAMASDEMLEATVDSINS